MATLLQLPSHHTTTTQPGQHSRDWLACSVGRCGQALHPLPWVALSAATLPVCPSDGAPGSPQQLSATPRCLFYK